MLQGSLGVLVDRCEASEERLATMAATQMPEVILSEVVVIVVGCGD